MKRKVPLGNKSSSGGRQGSAGNNSTFLSISSSSRIPFLPLTATADDDDDDEEVEDEEDDDHLFEPPPRNVKTKGKGSTTTIKRKRVVVEKQTLEKGSIWSANENAFTELQIAFIKRVEAKFGATIGTTYQCGYPGNKNGLTIICCLEANRFLAIEKCTCAFGLRAVWVNKNDLRVVRIVYVNLLHSPECAALRGTGRKNNSQMRHLGMTQSGSMMAAMRIPATNSLRFGIPKLIQDSRMAAGERRLTKSQSQRAAREVKKAEFKHYMTDLTTLPHLLLEFKRLDPEGTYYLETRPLSYVIDGVDMTTAREFVSLIISPGIVQTFWKNSYSKISQTDMAHRTGQMGGMQMSTVSRGCYFENIRTSFGIAEKENKDAWVSYTDCIAFLLAGTKLWLSDKDKGKLGAVICIDACLYLTPTH